MGFGRVRQFKRGDCRPLLCADLRTCPNPPDWRCTWRFLGIVASAQAEEIWFPIPALSAARTCPYREIRNDIERLWHDAAMHKARVFLGLERKLLDLSLVILARIMQRVDRYAGQNVAVA
jgi:hypothetical protein